MIFAPIITIDGPSGSGKGTLCRKLAKILCWNLLDSGSIYRTLTLLVLYNKISIDDEKSIEVLARNLDINFSYKEEQLCVFLGKKDISKEIRSEEIGSAASKIATFSSVRKTLLVLQRSFNVFPGLIADGRDMGTIVFPNARIKIFLYASLKSRAFRRMKQLQKNGFNVNIKDVLIEIKERDNRDSFRKESPLIPSSNAFLLDSTKLSIDEMTNKTLIYSRKILKLSV